MTTRTEHPLRTIEIRDGAIDLRINPTRTEVCLIFGAPDADVRLFRTMSLSEARGFCLRLDEQLKGVSP